MRRVVIFICALFICAHAAATFTTPGAPASGGDLRPAFVDFIGGIFEKDNNPTQYSNTMIMIKKRYFARIDVNCEGKWGATRAIHLATLDGDTIYIVSIECLDKVEEAWRKTMQDIANSVVIVASGAP